MLEVIIIGVALNTYLRTYVLKIVHIQGKSYNVEIVFFSYQKGLLLYERTCSLWEQILSL